MVKLGLDSFSYCSHLAEPGQDQVWFLDRLVELGLDGVQFDPMHLDSWDETLIRRIGKAAADRGLYLELGSGGFDYERLSKRLELAEEVGARLVRTFIGGERYETPRERREELIGYTIENFRRLAEVAERVCVPLALENHEDLNSEELIRILDAVDSPHVRAVLDTGNSLPVYEDPVDCARALAPYAAATHLKDWRFRWDNGKPIKQGCALGHGDCEVEAVYPIIRAAQPDIPVTMEIPSVRPDRQPQSIEEEEAQVVESIRFARELEAGLEQAQASPTISKSTP